MSKLYILSDLHCEFTSNMRAIKFNPSSDVDAVVIAGDINRGDRVADYLLKAFASRPELPIIYIAGNHEYHEAGVSVGEMHDIMRQQAQDARDNGRQLYFLEDEEVVLNLRGQSVRFLGATLWTDFALLGDQKGAMAFGERAVDDYDHSLFQDGNMKRAMRARDTVNMHMKSVEFLKDRLENPALKHVYDKTVVLTHHLPSAKSISPKYITSRSNVAFASHLDYLLELGAANLWVHGHTHESCEYVVDGKTWVVCNPYGYPYEDKSPLCLDLEVEI